MKHVPEKQSTVRWRDHACMQAASWVTGAVPMQHTDRAACASDVHRQMVRSCLHAGSVLGDGGRSCVPSPEAQGPQRGLSSRGWRPRPGWQLRSLPQACTPPRWLLLRALLCASCAA